ncbi:transporter [Paraburkholderia silviterrae]|uniref:Phenol degradation protein meta n=1 Tax=Paraburkholderia silviterrae TaxID=2528715 RepID=A0A4R5M334_9BURK|nr:transporter [Paraburkholderia silviterrae]TDG19999.1 phenol degradation protein meta [Paraburkholderia silviterrae]
MFRMKSLFVFCAIGFSLLKVACATENGLNHYPVGVNTIANGILPPPGQFGFYNYMQDYNSNSFMGDGGNKIIPGFHSNVAVDAPRFLYTWPITLGSFHITSGIIPTLLNVDVSAAGRHGHAIGLGDITLEPFHLSYWSPSHNLFVYFGTDIWIPTGTYNKNSLANTGLNYYSFSPNLNLTYYPNSKWEISTSISPEFNTKNHETNYHSGSDITIDASIGYRPIGSVQKLKVAVQGYYYRQLSGDSANGQEVDDGFKGRAIGLGPQLSYDIGHGGVALKFQKEFNVRNRPSGSRLWFEFASIF